VVLEGLFNFGGIFRFIFESLKAARRLGFMPLLMFQKGPDELDLHSKVGISVTVKVQTELRYSDVISCIDAERLDVASKPLLHVFD